MKEGDHPLTGPERLLIDAGHCAAGPLLSAAYALDAGDPEMEHPTWTHGWSGRRRVSLITRAELHAAHPGYWPEIPDLPGVVAGEVKRAWVRELRVPRTWLRKEYVDLALTSVVRAPLTQETGALTAKDEAIAQLAAKGVPAALAEGVRRRRQGTTTKAGCRQGLQARNTVRSLRRQL